jgi:hypothetical protein
MPLILGTNSIKDTGYNVANSLRFNDGSSDYLSRTPSSTGNKQTWTYSAWIKRGTSVASLSVLLGAYLGGSNRYSYIGFSSSEHGQDEIQFFSGNYTTGSSTTIASWINTDAVYRDFSAWYHIVIKCDFTESSASDVIKIYVNNVLQSTRIIESNATVPSNSTFFNTSGIAMQVGSLNAGSFFDGYMAEVIFIDGQALDPTLFGAFNPVTNIWEPRGYAGTYGTNGFRLDFANSSALGNDVSGNDNDFTVNNLTSIDQSTDTCSNNFATMNPLDSFYMTGTYSNGNLDIVTQSSSRTSTTATLGVSSGKWYWEVKLVDNSSNAECLVGIDTKGASSCSIFDSGKCDEYTGRRTYGYGYYSGDGNSFNNGSSTSFGNTYDTGDIIGVALDLDNNKLYFSKNGTFQNSGDPTSGATGTGAVSITAPSSTDTGVYFPAHSDASTSNNVTFSSNFGNPTFTISSGNNDGNGYGNFEYSVPSGYFSLCTKNLAEFG